MLGNSTLHSWRFCLAVWGTFLVVTYVEQISAVRPNNRQSNMPKHAQGVDDT